MRISRVVALLAVLVSLLAAQKQDSKQFGGTWEARFKGSVICTIKLSAGDTISGAMYGCAVHVNEDGDLIDTQFEGDPNEPSPVLNPTIEDQTLQFEQEDGGGRMKMELKVVSAGHAELRFVDAPVKIKPIRFERK